MSNRPIEDNERHRSHPAKKVFGIAGYSGSGKTTLIEKLLPHLTGAGLRVSVIKHAHHGFDLDRPGKDSYRHRVAGAGEVLITSNDRWALLHENPDKNSPEPALDEYIRVLSPCDLVLIEGFKNDPIPKLEVYRSQNGKPPLFPNNQHVVAVASDAAPDGSQGSLPWFDLNDDRAIALFILQTLELTPP